LLAIAELGIAATGASLANLPNLQAFAHGMSPNVPKPARTVRRPSSSLADEGIVAERCNSDRAKADTFWSLFWAKPIFRAIYVHRK
jgi:hypothetical protein